MSSFWPRVDPKKYSGPPKSASVRFTSSGKRERTA